MTWRRFATMAGIAAGDHRSFVLESWDTKDEMLIRARCLNCGAEISRDRILIHYDRQEETMQRFSAMGSASAAKFRNHKCGSN
jgi:hypothetical protein